MLFFALLRTKSQNLLQHWSKVEPLGYYFKGYNQPHGCSLSAGFTTTLQTCWKHLDVMYTKHVPAFNAKLRECAITTGCFDNHNEVKRKKAQTDGKSAVTHIGTAYALKQDRPIELLIGTKMRSPSGIHFVITSCEDIGDNQYFVCGSTPESNNTGRIANSELELIKNGSIWPSIGWSINSMPGLQPMPALEYHRQMIPPPLRAWVKRDTSAEKILLGGEKVWRPPLADDAEPLSTINHHHLFCMSRMLIDMQSHGFF
jgi:hypothetical protein